MVGYSAHCWQIMEIVFHCDTVRAVNGPGAATHNFWRSLQSKPNKIDNSEPTTTLVWAWFIFVEIKVIWGWCSDCDNIKELVLVVTLETGPGMHPGLITTVACHYRIKCSAVFSYFNKTQYFRLRLHLKYAQRSEKKVWDKAERCWESAERESICHKKLLKMFMGSLQTLGMYFDT